MIKQPGIWCKKKSEAEARKASLHQRGQEVKQNERVAILSMKMAALHKQLADNHRQSFHDNIQQHKSAYRENELLKQLEICKKEYGRLVDMEKEYEKMKQDFTWFKEQLECFTNKGESLMYPFQEEIYKRVIKEGVVLDGDRISYCFSFEMHRICTGNGRKLKVLRQYKDFREEEVFRVTSLAGFS